MLVLPPDEIPHAPTCGTGGVDAGTGAEVASRAFCVGESGPDVIFTNWRRS